MNREKSSLKSQLAAITIAFTLLATILASIAAVGSTAPLVHAQPWPETITTWMNVTGGSGSPNWIFRVGYPPSPFTVNIEVSGVFNLFAWEFKLSWNAALLDFTSVSEGDFLSGSGTTAFYYETYQDQADYDFILVNCTLLSGPGSSGSGIIATIDFDLDASATAGSTPLDLYDTRMRISSLEIIGHGLTDGFVFIGDHQMYPLIYMLPQTSVASLGEMFNVTAWVDNVESLQAWGFELKWSLFRLEATSIVNHVFLEGDSFHVENIDNLNGKAVASAVILGEQPGTYGSGPLATITFMVNEARASALDFADTDLIGIYYNPPEIPFTYPIEHASFDGLFQPAAGQPLARFTYSPLYPRANDTITFDASSSSDTDGNIVEHLWDFGDGAIQTITNPTTTHVYAMAGTYVVSLTVTDNDGLEDTVTDLVFVESWQPDLDPPVAIFHYSPPWPLANQTVTFNASYSYDPDGYIVSYAWNFGDGDTLIISDPVTTHTYYELGTYLINLTVMDNDGLTNYTLKYLTTVSPTTEVYVDPPTVTTSPDETFTIDIKVQGVADLFAWQVSLSWDASVLDFVNATEGDFLKGIEENPTLWFNKTYQDQVGNDTISIGCTRLGYVSGVDGSGTLASVSFRATEPRSTILDLFDTKLADSQPFPFPIEHYSTDGFVICEGPPIHDVAITFAEAYPTQTYPGNSVWINARVDNQGTATETFNVTAYYDDQRIETRTVWFLPRGEYQWLQFQWNTAGIDGGIYTVRVEADPVPEETDTADNTYIDGVVTIRVPKIAIDPASGPVGTKVVVNGHGFPAITGLYLDFDDQLMGLIYTDTNGEFTATFNIPLSEVGKHAVKAVLYYYMYPMAPEVPFTVIEVSPLDVAIDAGSIYFKHETAVFHIQTVLEGNPVDATSLTAQLRKPDGTTQALTPSRIGTGLYRVEYVITGKGSMTGTYTLLVEANYGTDTVSASGTSIKTFLVKPTWERELPRIAALSITSIGLIGGMLVLWRREKKRYL